MARRLARRREQLRKAVIANGKASMALLAGLAKAGMKPDAAERGAVNLVHDDLDAYEGNEGRQDAQQQKQRETLSQAEGAVQQCLGLPGAPLLVSQEEAAAALARCFPLISSFLTQSCACAPRVSGNQLFGFITALWPA
jgi:hypothetical protein